MLSEVSKTSVHVQSNAKVLLELPVKGGIFFQRFLQEPVKNDKISDRAVREKNYSLYLAQFLTTTHPYM